MQEHWKPLNLLVQWQHAAAWQIKLHEKSGCFLLHSSVSLFCDVRDKNVTWFFHFRGLHEFFKISFFLPTKCWSPTNSSEENLLDEIALIEFLLGAEADGNRGTLQNTAMGFLFAKQKTLPVLTHFLATLSLPSLQDCAVVMNNGTGVDEFSFPRSVLTHGPYSLCKDVPSSLRKNSGEDFHSWGRRRRPYTRQARSL